MKNIASIRIGKLFWETRAGPKLRATTNGFISFAMEMQFEMTFSVASKEIVVTRNSTTTKRTWNRWRYAAGFTSRRVRTFAYENFSCETREFYVTETQKRGDKNERNVSSLWVTLHTRRFKAAALIIVDSHQYEKGEKMCDRSIKT